MKKILILAAIGIILSSFDLAAQTVILINGEPTSVVLDQTEIIDILDTDVNDHMKGYDVTVPAISLRQVKAVKPLVKKKYDQWRDIIVSTGYNEKKTLALNNE